MRHALSLYLAMTGALSAPGLVAADDQAPAKPEQGDKPVVDPKPADSDAPLPKGFPEATRPGVIEVKAYPVYRSAVAKGQGMTTGSGDMLFWSLFRHIDTKGVAMTAPVINTYENEKMIDDPAARGEVQMEFLYERPDQGETGKGVGAVEVVDHPSGQFVCLGVQGQMGEDQMRAGLDQLRSWLEEHKGEYVAAGPPRRLGYHGPMTPAARRLWEVQIPVKPAPADQATEVSKP